MWGHVDDHLARFCEGALPEPEARSVEAHLAQCRRCQDLRVEVERGLALVRALPAARLPEARAEEIRRALADPEAAANRPLPPRRRRGTYAAAAMLLGCGGLCLLYWNRPPLYLEAAGAPPSAFEETALALQRQAAAGTLRLQLTTDSPPAVRAWVRNHTGLSADVALNRPAEDGGRFELLGATEVKLAGTRAAAVVYLIDTRPAVLLTARADEVPDRAGSWTLANKTVRHHVDLASGAKRLSWTNSGQAYTLVSELPGLGLESCLLCHTDPSRRALIRRIGRERRP